MSVMPNLRRCLHALVIAGALWMHLPVQAAEALRATIFDIPPYGVRVSHAQVGGLYVDVIRALAAEAGYEPSFRLAPFARVQHDLKSGVADVTISFLTMEGADSLIALAPIMDSDVIVVPRKGAMLRTPGSLKHRAVGRLRGGCIDLAAGKAARLIDLNTISDGLRMLKLGRLDGLCLTRETYALYLEREKLEAMDFDPPLLINRRSAWLLLRSGAPPAMQARLHEAIKALNARGVIRAIHKSYLPAGT